MESFCGKTFLLKVKESNNKNPCKVIPLPHKELYGFDALAKRYLKDRIKDVDGNLVNCLLIKSLKFDNNSPGIEYYQYGYNVEFKKIVVVQKADLPFFANGFANVHPTTTNLYCKETRLIEDLRTKYFPISGASIIQRLAYL